MTLATPRTEDWAEEHRKAVEILNVRSEIMMYQRQSSRVSELREGLQKRLE